VIFRRLRFIRAITAREWLALFLCGAGLGLSVAWLQRTFQLEPRVVRLVLLVLAVVLLLLFAFLLVAYVRELRRAEDEWAGRDEEDAD
jgi:hypothetical protein